MTSIIQYNVDTIQKIVENFDYNLSENIQMIFDELDKKIIAEDDSMSYVPLKRSDRSFDKGKGKKRFYKSSSKSSSLNNMNIEDWESVRNFKPTEKIEVSDFDKEINEIRSHINKLSKTNYETQKQNIIDKLVDLFSHETGELFEQRDKIVTIIFDICSSNKFLSEVYADLYVEIVGYNDLFGDILDDYIINFKETLKNICYIDPDVNYDGFCEYNKVNEIRKSNAEFLINLMKRDMIEKTEILKLIDEMLSMCFAFIDQESKLHEVEEITENIFLLVTSSKEVLQTTDYWKENIENKIAEFTKLKAKNHISLSSRSVFKFMDM